MKPTFHVQYLCDDFPGDDDGHFLEYERSQFVITGKFNRKALLQAGFKITEKTMIIAEPQDGDLAKELLPGMLGWREDEFYGHRCAVLVELTGIDVEPVNNSISEEARDAWSKRVAVKVNAAIEKLNYSPSDKPVMKQIVMLNGKGEISVLHTSQEDEWAIPPKKSSVRVELLLKKPQHVVPVCYEDDPAAGEKCEAAIAALKLAIKEEGGSNEPPADYQEQLMKGARAELAL